MYPPLIAAARPDAAAYVMAGRGDVLSYRQLDEQSNQLAHLLRQRGIGPGGTLVLVAENRIEWPVVVAAGMRTGLYVTPLNWHLTEAETAALLAEALAGGAPAAVITTQGRAQAVWPALGDGVTGLCLDGACGPLESFPEAVSGLPGTPVRDELLGARVLYSGGTTGRPTAFRQKLLGVHPAAAPPRHAGLTARLGIDERTVFLSPAPSYHAAPFTFQLIIQEFGGTVVCLERFDPLGALAAIERYRVSHSQWVPTMLSRLVRLGPAERSRHDLSTHRVAWTSGGPCAVALKAAVTDWWGPILHEYYGSSEGYGHTYVSPAEALAHPGTVGRPLTGGLHIADETGAEVAPGTVGRVWFAGQDRYVNLAEVPGQVHPAGWRSAGDLGYLDEDGFLYLVGRADHGILSGGVTIFPDEIEEVLLGHPAVADVAVFGVPDPDLGEQVKAVVQVRSPALGGDLSAELITFCQARLARFKIPKSVGIVAHLPRLPTGKLNKAALRERYLHGDR